VVADACVVSAVRGPARPALGKNLRKLRKFSMTGTGRAATTEGSRGF